MLNLLQAGDMAPRSVLQVQGFSPTDCANGLTRAWGFSSGKHLPGANKSCAIPDISQGDLKNISKVVLLAV